MRKTTVFSCASSSSPAFEKTTDEPLKKGFEPMKKRTFLPFLTLMLAISLCSCATMSVVKIEHLNDQELAVDSAPVAHIYVANWGYYLFKYIPIVTGNLDYPESSNRTLWFKDNVRVDALVDRLTEKSKELGATVVTDLRSSDKSGWLWYTLIIWLNEVEVSANASKKQGQEQTK